MAEVVAVTLHVGLRAQERVFTQVKPIAKEVASMGLREHARISALHKPMG